MDNLCSLVVCGAPLASRAGDIAVGLIEAGWRVQVLTTPAAAQWVDVDELARVIGQPVRSQQRSPDQPKGRVRPSAIAVAPMTFNSIGKLAGGIADTLAHSAMNEALGEGIPFVALPMVNQYLAGHPTFGVRVAELSRAGVTWVSLLDGSAGDFEPVLSGTGEQLVKDFDPQWVSGHLPTLRPPV